MALTGTILTLRGTTTPLYDIFTLGSISMTGRFAHDASVNSVVTRFGQQLQPTGFVYSGPSANTTSWDGRPQTQGSPNATQEFVVEVLYPQGMGPNYALTVDQFKALAIAAINPAFGLALA